jgi:hypothetical protein
MGVGDRRGSLNFGHLTRMSTFMENKTEHINLSPDRRGRSKKSLSKQQEEEAANKKTG